MNQARVDAMKQLFGGSMTQRELDVLRDMQAFITFCIENGLSFRTAVGTISHDVNGILAPGDMFERGIFAPKVLGYQRVLSDLSEEMAAMGADADLQDELPREH